MRDATNLPQASLTCAICSDMKSHEVADALRSPHPLRHQSGSIIKSLFLHMTLA